MKNLILPLAFALVTMPFSLAHSNLNTFRCRDKVAGMIYRPLLSENLEALQVEGKGFKTQIEDLKSRYEDVYQSGRLLAKRWHFEGFYRFQHADRLVVGTLTQYLTGPTILSVEHYPTNGAPLLYSEGLICKSGSSRSY